MKGIAALLAAAYFCVPNVPAAAGGLAQERPRTPSPAAQGRPAWFRAHGNEPFWSLDIAFGKALFSALGWEALDFLAPIKSTETGDDWTRHVAVHGGERLTATIYDRISTCDMAGIVHPNTVVVEWGGRTWEGRGGEPADLLVGRDWSVREVGGRSVGENFAASLRFHKDGTVFGNTPSGPFAACFMLTGESMNFFRVTAFPDGDAPAVLEQERAFFAMLRQTDLFAIAEDGSLILEAKGERIVAASPGNP